MQGLQTSSSTTLTIAESTALPRGGRVPDWARHCLARALRCPGHWPPGKTRAQGVLSVELMVWNTEGIRLIGFHVPQVES
jgi:hypothetical protein